MLRLVDVRELSGAAPGEQLASVDLADFAATRHAMSGVDVAVHLAAIPHEDSFDRLLEANVRATYNVFEAARQAGVRRVVLASSYHVTGFYRRDQRIGPSAPVRPDTMYAVTKVFGEAVGRLYADKWGIEVVCVRIGAFQERPQSQRPQSRDAVGSWLSPRDALRLFTAAITAPQVGYVVVYGASRQRHTLWDNPGAASLGYQPLDEFDAAADAQLRVAAPAPDTPQGGSYARPDYRVEP
jgi:uronate dehydrogenase